MVPCGSIHSRSLHQFLLLQHLRRRLGSSGRKPFILITCFGAGITASMWGLFEGTTLLVFAIVAALVSVVTSSFPIVTLGYFKDCVPHQALNKVADSIHRNTGVAPSGSPTARSTSSTGTDKKTRTLRLLNKSGW